MRLIVRRGGRARLSVLQERITRMPLADLIVYEATLWQWMDALNKRNMGSLRIVDQLNAIYREIEWRAGEKEWNDAAHS